MKAIILAAAMSAACAIPALAIERDAASPEGAGLSVAQKRSEILQHIDRRIASSMEEKVCIKAAQSHIEFRACREKFRPPKPKDELQNRNQ